MSQLQPYLTMIAQGYTRIFFLYAMVCRMYCMKLHSDLGPLWMVHHLLPVNSSMEWMVTYSYNPAPFTGFMWCTGLSYFLNLPKHSLGNLLLSVAVFLTGWQCICGTRLHLYFLHTPNTLRKHLNQYFMQIQMFGCSCVSHSSLHICLSFGGNK